jgi:hypothetical protein
MKKDPERILAELGSMSDEEAQKGHDLGIRRP